MAVVSFRCREWGHNGRNWGINIFSVTVELNYWWINKCCQGKCSKLPKNSPGPVFCLLLRVSSGYVQPITGQVTEVTCPVIGRAQSELTPSKIQKTGPGYSMVTCAHLGGWWPDCFLLGNTWSNHYDVTVMFVILNSSQTLPQNRHQNIHYYFWETDQD